MKYVHRDHLGSTDVLTDSTGAMAQRMSFDAFGKRRDAATWSDSALYAYAFEGGLGFSVTPQFTGHTGLGHLELVHMNGRVYDPMIGRFLSADPYVQDPTSPQDFNRYSYVGNNPLSFIDPSGYFAEGPAPPPSGGGDFLSFLSRLFGNQPARHNSRYPAWARRLATKQWQAPIVGVVSSFAPTGPWGAAIIGAGLQAAVNGGSVGEVLLVSAAGVSLAMSNRGNGAWSNRSAGNAIRGGGNWLSKLGENGFGNAATTVFQLQEAVAAATEESQSEPTYRPAPPELIGTREYYIWRNENAPESFKSGEGPNYYIDYGLHKFDQFQALREGASPELQGFIDRTSVELQLGLEAALEANPAIELNRGTLFDAAIDTHSDAYRAGGFKGLSFPDKARVLRTGGRDIFVRGGLREVWQSRDLLLP